METLKRWARRVVNAPENPAPTVSSKDWVKSHFDTSPKNAVRGFSSLSIARIHSHIPAGPWLPQVSFPCLSMGTQLQRRVVRPYILRILQCLNDLPRLYGDLIAGLTVGLVLVPQGMSYAKVSSSTLSR
jgi:sodium-independent sulfate anion transporter 11